MEKFSHVYSLPEVGLSQFIQNDLQIFLKWKKAWIEKLVTKHLIDLMSGRAQIAARCPESPKAFCLNILWLSTYSLPGKQSSYAA